MPSKIIGRVPCPECGFESAHVKQKTLPSGEVDTSKKPYRYCPSADCGSQYFPKSEAAAARLVGKMRPTEAPKTPAPEPKKTAEALKSGPQASAEAGAGAGVAKSGDKAAEGAKSKKRGFLADLGI